MDSRPEGQGDRGAHAGPTNRGFTFRIVETTPEGPPEWTVAIVTSWFLPGHLRSVCTPVPGPHPLQPGRPGMLVRFSVPSPPEAHLGSSLPVAPAGWGPGGVRSGGAALTAWLVWGRAEGGCPRTVPPARSPAQVPSRCCPLHGRRPRVTLMAVSKAPWTSESPRVSVGNVLRALGRGGRRGQAGWVAWAPETDWNPGRSPSRYVCPTRPEGKRLSREGARGQAGAHARRVSPAT